MREKLNNILTRISEADAQGDVITKVQLLKEATELAIQLEGRGSNAHLALASEYGGNLRYVGQTKEAIKVLAEVCELTAPCCSNMTDEYCTALINLAGAYLYDGNLEQSESLYLEAKNALPMKDYRYASICNNMSALYQQQGKYDKAIATMEEALSIIPDDSPDYVEDYCSTLGNTAYVLISMYEAVKNDVTNPKDILQRANEYLSMALKKLKEYHKEDQVIFASIINQKASIMYLLGEYTYALAYYQEAYEICKNKLGERSSACVTIQKNIEKLESVIGQ